MEKFTCLRLANESKTNRDLLGGSDVKNPPATQEMQF